MECFNCGNCKENQPIYYCIAKNEVVINPNYVPENKGRDSWKKGSKDYEIHRRKARSETEL